LATFARAHRIPTVPNFLHPRNCLEDLHKTSFFLIDHTFTTNDPLFTPPARFLRRPSTSPSPDLIDEPPVAAYP
jgi:hypothetical protein